MAILVRKISPDKLATLYNGPIFNRTRPEMVLAPIFSEPTPETYKTIPEFKPLLVKSRLESLHFQALIKLQ